MPKFCILIPCGVKVLPNKAYGIHHIWPIMHHREETINNEENPS